MVSLALGRSAIQESLTAGMLTTWLVIVTLKLTSLPQPQPPTHGP